MNVFQGQVADRVPLAIDPLDDLAKSGLESHLGLPTKGCARFGRIDDVDLVVPGTRWHLFGCRREVGSRRLADVLDQLANGHAAVGGEVVDLTAAGALHRYQLAARDVAD